MKMTVFILLMLFFKLSFSQWSLISSGYPNVMLTDITQTPSGKIFAVGTAVNASIYTPLVFKSSDNGANWDTIHVPPLGYFFQTIGFLNDNIGYIGVGGGAYILQTIDSGNTWNYFYQNSSGTAINDIEVIDSISAVACGFGSSFYSSGAAYTLTNQTNWASIAQSFPSTTLDDMQMLNQNDGYALSLFGKEIFRTTNGGQSWTLVNSFPSTVEKMFWWNTNSGIAVGINANYYITSNGGFSWSRDSIANPNDELTGVAFFDSNNGYACAAGGKLFSTTNGGNTWNTEATITTYDFYNLEIHGGYAYAVGQNGNIARHANPLGIFLPEQKNESKLFPNPAHDKVVIQSQSVVEGILITNVLGRIVIDENNIGSKIFSVNISALSDGVYFLKLCSKQSVLTQRLIVQH